MTSKRPFEINWPLPRQCYTRPQSHQTADKAESKKENLFIYTVKNNSLLANSLNLFSMQEILNLIGEYF